MPSRRQEALDYHAQGRPGKIQVSPTKPFKNQRDLSLAYTPGVAEPCREIAARPEEVYTYTIRGNLVAVVTNGTAVLGLGNIGPLAAKPVMEGKGILFKAFADIDVFDLEVGSEDPEDVIRFCQLLEPTVGGINLEDIRSPDCFYIEEKLREMLSIPVFHDDQHGTAIISGAALLNALEVVEKDIGRIKVVFSGAGAAAIATAEHYVRLGVTREQIVMCDHRGVIHVGRDDLDRYKSRFATRTKARTLADALKDADVFVGLSVAGIVTGDMLKGMAPRPIVFALANPTPEIMPEDAGLRPRPAAVRAGVPDPQAVRPAGAVVGGTGGGVGGGGLGGGGPGDRRGRVPGAARRAAGPGARGDARALDPGAAGGAARGVPRGRGPADPQGRPDPRRRGDRGADPAGRSGRDPPPGGRRRRDAGGNHAREPAGQPAPRHVRATAVGAAAA